METQALRKRKTAITAASIERTQARVENAIATAFEPEEVLQAYEMAAACKLLAKQVDASRSIQNRCAASHTKAVRKIGEVTQRMRDEGLLAKHGQNRDVDSDDIPDRMSSQSTSRMALSDLGFSRDIAAAGVKLLTVDPSEIDAMALAATESEQDFSCRRFVSDIRRAEKEQNRDSRREENRKKVQHVSSVETLETLRGVKFATIVVDPPWDWGDEGDQDQLGRARPDYSTMTIEQLHGLGVADLADDDCHLYLWITNRSLPKGFALMEAWGFRYVTAITWVKPSFGMGNYFRGQTEHVLFGVKGSQALKRKDVGTAFFADRGPDGHSSKPTTFLDLVESCSPGPYVEMFSRLPRDGWVCWGEDAK
jgi:N6-adenosine-specific RNA methylase IME4